MRIPYIRDESYEELFRRALEEVRATRLHKSNADTLDRLVSESCKLTGIQLSRVRIIDILAWMYFVGAQGT